ncbi:glycosyltransferase family 32 protein [Didymella exigua CBS 183.55]|uniref:Glycosyltransferase family 32 protein n=1 Tax=Didymella exigua CBS 183.55 TaxID=1150837 RepID=A0A6A5R8U5_9PLEO|nr:glycosyltransferase family 32 protein [Didymella exigua CBS 183.55]KAF1923769.1 glycosyltransferase family 32 protein [Didymella exigua CBS 183.55]
MFFSRKASLSREAFTYFTLLALCTLASVYHFYTSTSAISRDIQHLILPFPPGPTSPIPKTLWYKVGPRGRNNEITAWTNSCITANPDYDVRFLTDEDAEHSVSAAFSNRANILEAYSGLTVPVLKADMLRYMMLYDQGGVWLDPNVSCEEVPIDEWIASEFREKAGLVVGWAFDVGPSLGMSQFASWAIMARPRSPHVLAVIERIVDALRGVMKEHRVSMGNVTLNLTGDAVGFSGPGRLTTGVFESLEHTLNRTVSLDEAREILQPVLLGDVLVMPGRSFAASMNDYSKKGGGSGLLPPRLVTHHYAGMWKNGSDGE